MVTVPARPSWLLTPRPRPLADMRLFCLPYAGGAASLFHSWADQLPPTLELCAIQLPGRESRFHEPGATSLAELLPALAGALAPHLDRPFVIFGHSMGALIGFELTRYLAHQAMPQPIHLLVAGHRAPQLPAENAPIHALPDNEFLAALRRYNGTPAQVLEDREFLAALLPLLRADLALCERYTHVPGAPLTCPISAFGGREDPHATVRQLFAWREHTRREFSVRMLPGDHFFLRTAQQQLIAAISDDLRVYLDI